MSAATPTKRRIAPTTVTSNKRDEQDDQRLREIVTAGGSDATAVDILRKYSKDRNIDESDMDSSKEVSNAEATSAARDIRAALARMSDDVTAIVAKIDGEGVNINTDEIAQFADRVISNAAVVNLRYKNRLPRGGRVPEIALAKLAREAEARAKTGQQRYTEAIELVSKRARVEAEKARAKRSAFTPEQKAERKVARQAWYAANREREAAALATEPDEAVKIAMRRLYASEAEKLPRELAEAYDDDDSDSVSGSDDDYSLNEGDEDSEESIEYDVLIDDETRDLYLVDGSVDSDTTYFKINLQLGEFVIKQLEDNTYWRGFKDSDADHIQLTAKSLASGRTKDGDGSLALRLKEWTDFQVYDDEDGSESSAAPAPMQVDKRIGLEMGPQANAALANFERVVREQARLDAGFLRDTKALESSQGISLETSDTSAFTAEQLGTYNYLARYSANRARDSSAALGPAIDALLAAMEADGTPYAEVTAFAWGLESYIRRIAADELSGSTQEQIGGRVPEVRPDQGPFTAEIHEYLLTIQPADPAIARQMTSEERIDTFKRYEMARDRILQRLRTQGYSARESNEFVGRISSKDSPEAAAIKRQYRRSPTSIGKPISAASLSNEARSAQLEYLAAKGEKASKDRTFGMFACRPRVELAEEKLRRELQVSGHTDSEIDAYLDAMRTADPEIDPRGRSIKKKIQSAIRIDGKVGEETAYAARVIVGKMEEIITKMNASTMQALVGADARELGIMAEVLKELTPAGDYVREFGAEQLRLSFGTVLPLPKNMRAISQLNSAQKGGVMLHYLPDVESGTQSGIAVLLTPPNQSEWRQSAFNLPANVTSTKSFAIGSLPGSPNDPNPPQSTLLAVYRPVGFTSVRETRFLAQLGGDVAGPLLDVDLDQAFTYAVSARGMLVGAKVNNSGASNAIEWVVQLYSNGKLGAATNGSFTPGPDAVGFPRQGGEFKLSVRVSTAGQFSVTLLSLYVLDGTGASPTDPSKVTALCISALLVDMDLNIETQPQFATELYYATPEAARGLQLLSALSADRLLTVAVVDRTPGTGGSTVYRMNSNNSNRLNMVLDAPGVVIGAMSSGIFGLTIIAVPRSSARDTVIFELVPVNTPKKYSVNNTQSTTRQSVPN